MSKNYVISIDTNGIPKNNDFSNVDLVSFSIIEVNFHDMSPVREPLSVLINVDDLHNTEKFHGWTKEILTEIGIPLEDAITELLDYIIDDNVAVKLIGVNLDNFIIPMLQKYFLAYEINVPFDKNHVDISSACKILLNTDYFDETLDVLGITNKPIKNSGAKMDSIIDIINTLRSLVHGN